MAIVLAAVLLFFVAAARIELSEQVAVWGQGYEHWQLDEVPLTLLLLSIGLAWFAFRRTLEAGQELRERIQAEAQVGVLLARNRDLSQRLILAQESERHALARELHDEFGQNCTAIRAEASYIARAQSGDGTGIQASARRIEQAAQDLDALVRDILQRLRPAALDSLGLAAAVQELCESWEEQSGIACAFFPQGVPHHIDDATGIALFRLVQEGLTNVARHSGADQVRIDLRAGADRRSFALIIQDNGRGMTDSAARHDGFGLLGMRERVAGLRGTIDLRSTPGNGLRIEIVLPVDAELPQ